MATHANSTPMPSARQRSPWAGISRDRLAEAVDRLIAVLDDLKGDADAEPDACAELSPQPEIRGGALSAQLEGTAAQEGESFLDMLRRWRKLGPAVAKGVQVDGLREVDVQKVDDLVSHARLAIVREAVSQGFDTLEECEIGLEMLLASLRNGVAGDAMDQRLCSELQRSIAHLAMQPPALPFDRNALESALGDLRGMLRLLDIAIVDTWDQVADQKEEGFVMLCLNRAQHDNVPHAIVRAMEDMRKVDAIFYGEAA